MHELIEAKRAAIEDLCQRPDVRRLDLFGSATGASFNVATSDVDVLVGFDVHPGFDYFETFFALKEGLEEILERPVDLVSSSSISNPYFRRIVMETKEMLYAA